MQAKASLVVLSQAEIQAVIQVLKSRVLERVLAMGVTGSGKSFQWLKMAELLLPYGVRFRCIDTDNDIMYMLETAFPHLKPENGGNVYVHLAFDWPEYKQAINWIQRKPLDIKKLEAMGTFLAKDYKEVPLKPYDWTVVDMADNAWKTVQSHFTEQVFGEDAGDYFLQIRKEMEAGIRKTAKGGVPSSVVAEGLDGWKDWSVINKLYDDWMLPIVFRIRTHVWATTKVEKVGRDEKDAEIALLFGDIGVRPSGQKALGHQMHSIFLFIPGKEKWFITTVKDRSNRAYFSKIPLTSFYMQYLVAKAGWPIL